MKNDECQTCIFNNIKSAANYDNKESLVNLEYYLDRFIDSLKEEEKKIAKFGIEFPIEIFQ